MTRGKKTPIEVGTATTAFPTMTLSLKAAAYARGNSARVAELILSAPGPVRTAWVKKLAGIDAGSGFAIGYGKYLGYWHSAGWGFVEATLAGRALYRSSPDWLDRLADEDSRLADALEGQTVFYLPGELDRWMDGLAASKPSMRLAVLSSAMPEVQFNALQAVRVEVRTAKEGYRDRAIREGIGRSVHWTELDESACAICGHGVDVDVHANHPEAPTVDHIRPLAAGGTHTWDNLQIAHRACNSAKGARAA